MALKAKMWRNGGFECLIKDIAMNARLREGDEREYASV